jgi:hypothetical protein
MGNSTSRSGGPRHVSASLDRLVADLEARRERFARLGRIACELDDLVLEITSGPLEDHLLNLASWAGYLATSVRALDVLFDEVSVGDRS